MHVMLGDLPDLVLQDGERLDVDRERHSLELEIFFEPLHVGLHGEVYKLEDVIASGEHHLERLVILLLAPPKLTRLVEQAVEGMQILVIAHHAVRPAQDGLHATGDSKF